jgi:hypothetical protein
VVAVPGLREIVMLDHAGDVLILLGGFWRFTFSRSYRARKIEEWRQTRGSVGGSVAVAAEVVVGAVIGVGLPVAIGLVIANALGLL